jgi:hypothetical protein
MLALHAARAACSVNAHVEGNAQSVTAATTSSVDGIAEASLATV